MQRENKNFIPDGWAVKRISELGTVVSGGTPDTANQDYWDGDILWVTPSEISKLKNKYLENTERKITEFGLKNSSATILPEKSIIVCTRATVGDCCINKNKTTTNQGFKSLVPKNNSPEFIYYLFSENERKFLRLGCGSTFLEVSKKDFEKIKFIIPPLSEQEGIAVVLGDWDNALELLDKQIELKTQQKKYLMQTLLTGDVRLPGFTTPWDEVKLSDLAVKMQSGGTPKSTNDKYYQGNIPFVKVNDITRSNKYLTDTETKITEDGLKNSSAWKVPKNSILYSMYASIGFCCINKIEVTTNQAIMNIIPKKDICLDFLYYSLGNYQSKVIKFIEQGTQGNLNAEIVKSLKINIPTDINEQNAIADVLTAADDEITFLQQRRELVAQQKKYLMQNLLTGQIRIPIKKDN